MDWLSLFSSNKAMFVVLAMCLMLILRSLLVRSRVMNSAIDLDDLLLGDDGKMSKAAAVMFGSFFLTSWGMAYMWLNNHMTEGYFGAYLAAWVAPAVAKIIKGASA